MKRLLLINEGRKDNLGDEAIRYTLQRLLEDANCTVQCASFSGQRKPKGMPARQRRQLSKSWFKTLVRKLVPVELRWLLRRWPVFLRCLKANRYDLILIGGGQLIQSNGAFGLATFIWVYLFKKLHKQKVILIAVGAAERYTAFDRMLYRKSLQLVDSIYVRDRTSLCVLKNVFGVSSKLIPDVAFYISKIYKYPPGKEKRALFCPTSYEFYKSKRNDPDIGPDEDEYLQYWEARMLEYSNDDYQIKLFCTNKQQDLSTTKKLKQFLYNKHSIDVEILDISTLEELTKEIAKSQVVVSGRMHALVIGYCYGCTVIPYRTSAKIDAFEEEYINSRISLNEVQKQIRRTIDNVVGEP